MNLGKQVREAALSPDAKTIAVAARGEIFVRSTEKDRPTRRVTDSPAKTASSHGHPTDACSTLRATPPASGDLHRDRGNVPRRCGPRAQNRAQGRAKGREEDRREERRRQERRRSRQEGRRQAPEKADKPQRSQLKRKTPRRKSTKASAGPRRSPSQPPPCTRRGRRGPQPAPLARRQAPHGHPRLGRPRALHLDDKGAVVTSSERVILPSWNDADVQWAADSRHIVYAIEDLNFNSDIWLLDLDATAGADDARPVNLTRHPDSDHAPA